MAKFVSWLLSRLTGIGVCDGFKIAVLMLFEIWWSQLHAELYVDTHMCSIKSSIHPQAQVHMHTCTKIEISTKSAKAKHANTIEICDFGSS